MQAVCKQLYLLPADSPASLEGEVSRGKSTVPCRRRGFSKTQHGHGLNKPSRHWDPFSWTQLITKHTKLRQGREALRTYYEMREEGIIPNNYTLVAALKACSIIGDLDIGKKIHSHVIQSPYDTDIYIANTLVDMYAKCGSIEDARQVFEMMPRPHLVAWNAIIMGYAKMGMGESALQLYELMHHEGFSPNNRTFVAALKACGSLAEQGDRKTIDGKLWKIRCLEQGRAIHSEAANRGLVSDIFIATALIDMYAKCGSILDALQVFEQMMHPNVVSWTSMIMGCTETDMGHLAMDLYERMKLQGYVPNDRTFVAVLKACSSLAAQEEGQIVDGKLLKLRCLERGRMIHSEILNSGNESDVFVASTLVDMYAKCGSAVDASQVFEKMAHRNVVSWNAMITGYVQMEMPDLALDLYLCMKSDGVAPNDRTFVAAVKACGSLAAQEEGKETDGISLKIKCLKQGRGIHSEIAKGGFESDVFVASSLIDMYAKCRSMADARRVFEKMQQRDVTSWNTMILGYTQMEMGEMALELYSRMKLEGFAPDTQTFVAVLKACGSLAAQEGGKGVEYELLKARSLERGRAIHDEAAKGGYDLDIFVASTLVDMYSKCGSIVDACHVFEKIQHHDLVSWTAMIMGYTQVEMGQSALELYVRMRQEGFIPDAHTFVAALKACSILASLETGKEIHAEIQRAGLEAEPFVASCLVDMYGKCGSMVDAQQFFDSLLARDFVTWTALMSGYSGQGDSAHVFDLYKRMQQEGLKPVGITYISVLTVCSHNGLLDMGQTCFQEMCIKYRISPSSKHYMSMVDLLGRAGQLDESLSMVKKMPYEPDIVTWITILGTCRKWNNVEIGRNAFECAVILDEKCAAAYLLMKNIYAVSYMWQETAKIREMITKQSLEETRTVQVD